MSLTPEEKQRIEEEELRAEVRKKIESEEKGAKRKKEWSPLNIGAGCLVSFFLMFGPLGIVLVLWGAIELFTFILVAVAVIASIVRVKKRRNNSTTQLWEFLYWSFVVCVVLFALSSWTPWEWFGLWDGSGGPINQYA